MFENGSKYGPIVANIILACVVECLLLGALGPSPDAQVLEVASVKNSHGALANTASGTSSGSRAFEEKRNGAHYTGRKSELSARGPML